MILDTVLINFKGLGIKANVNKADFNPVTQKLWTYEDEEALKSPLPRKPVETKEPGKPGRPAKIVNE